MARYVAKHIVAAGLAKRCEIQLGYAIGVAQPVSLCVNTFGTGTVNDNLLEEWILSHIDLRPAAIIQKLQLRKPIFYRTAAYGHFGRDIFSWEQIDEQLLSDMKKLQTL